jgi:hypothetical protein
VIGFLAAFLQNIPTKRNSYSFVLVSLLSGSDAAFCVSAGDYAKAEDLPAQKRKEEVQICGAIPRHVGRGMGSFKLDAPTKFKETEK